MGVWVSVSEKSFNDYQSHFHDNPGNVVYFGMICNWLPPYETDTFGLHCNVVTHPTTDVLCCNCIKAANIRWYTTFITA